IGLIFWDSDMAASFGFALSCAATASIVILTPMIHRVLAPLRWPDILSRALAVAIAADLATMPLVALMSGEISLVSVVVNVLVAPVSAPITIVGLIAAGLAQLPIDGAAFLLLKIIEPCTWWIYHIASGAQQLPVSVISASPVVVLLVYGWIIRACLAKLPYRGAAFPPTQILEPGTWGIFYLAVWPQPLPVFVIPAFPVVVLLFLGLN